MSLTKMSPFFVCSLPYTLFLSILSSSLLLRFFRSLPFLFIFYILGTCHKKVRRVRTKSFLIGSRNFSRFKICPFSPVLLVFFWFTKTTALCVLPPFFKNVTKVCAYWLQNGCNLGCCAEFSETFSLKTTPFGQISLESNKTCHKKVRHFRT